MARSWTDCKVLILVVALTAAGRVARADAIRYTLTETGDATMQLENFTDVPLTIALTGKPRTS